MADLATMSNKEVLTQRSERWKEACGILELAKAEGRETSAGENERYDAIIKDVNALDAAVVSRRETLKRQEAHNALSERLNESAGRQTQNALETVAKAENDLKVWMGKKNPDSLSADMVGRCNPNTVEAFGKLNKLASNDYRNAFAQYVGTGQAQLGMQIGQAPKGGFIAPTTMITQLIIFLSDLVFVRSKATKFSLPNAVSMGAVSWETDPADADWTQEVPANSIAADAAAAMGKRELSPNLLTKLIRISQQLMNVSIFDIEGFLVQRLAYKFGITEEKAFMTGSFDKQPGGLFTASAMGIPASRDVTTKAANMVTFDDLILLKGNCKYQYQNNGQFLLSRTLINTLRQIKVSTTYAWQPALTLSNPDMILGSEYGMSEYVPNATTGTDTYTSGGYVALFGDLSFYWIADSLEMQVQRLIELFSLTNEVGVKAMKATDGMPVLAEAFSRLKAQ
jgi:HK97 family phage major capsid protein